MKYLVVNSDTGEIVSELTPKRWEDIHQFLLGYMQPSHEFDL